MSLSVSLALFFNASSLKSDVHNKTSKQNSDQKSKKSTLFDFPLDNFSSVFILFSAVN